MVEGWKSLGIFKGELGKEDSSNPQSTTKGNEKEGEGEKGEGEGGERDLRVRLLLHQRGCSLNRGHQGGCFDGGGGGGGGGGSVSVSVIIMLLC